MGVGGGVGGGGGGDFFFNDTATTEIYTLSLHDALPIYNNRTEAEAGSVDADEINGARGTDDHTIT